MKEQLEKTIKFLLWEKKPSIFFKDITGFIPTQQQARFLDALSNPSNSRMILSAPIGSGKTFTLGITALWSATVHSIFLNKPLDILIVSGSLNQAKIVYEYVRKFILHPYIKPLIRGEPIQTKTEFQNDSTIRVVASSETSFYGFHPNVLLMDEACIVPDVLVRDALSRIAPSSDARLILCSTPYNFFSEFVNIWSNEAKYPEWKRFQWKIDSCHWISKDVIEEAKRLLPENEFKAKWEAVPSAIVGALFNTEDLKECLIDYKPARLEEGEVSMGIDFGVEHPTVFEIVQYSEPNIIHLKEEVLKRKSSEYIQNRALELVDEYKVNYVYTDASSIWENQRLEVQLRPKGVVLKPIPFKSHKGIMMSFLKSLIEQHKLRIYEGEVELIRELSNYTLETKRNDDRVDSLSLACYAFLKYKERASGTRSYLFRQIPI